MPLRRFVLSLFLPLALLGAAPGGKRTWPAC
jgi:hypothetical protein